MAPTSATDPIRIPLQLADGLSLRLTASRARQHLHRTPRPNGERPVLRALAPLIDVEVLDGDVGQFRYSGMSLADLIAALRARSDDAFEQVMATLFDHQADLERLAAVAKTTSLQERLLVLPTPPYVAALAAHLEHTGPRTAPVAQWLGLLDAATSRGIRQHEIDASGLRTRLGILPAQKRLTRRDVLSRLGFSHVAPRLVSEVRVGFLTTAGWKTAPADVPVRRWRGLDLIGRPPLATHEIRYRHRGLGWGVVRSIYEDLLTHERETWCVVDDKGRRASAAPMSFPNSRAAMNWAEAEMARRFASWPLKRRQQRWKQHSLVGAAGYEELLLQLDASTDSFWSTHFPDVRNVLAHARISRHDVEDGRRVLFIDELQSDWVSAWSRDRHAVPAPPFHAEWVQLALKTLVWWAQQTGCAGVAFSTPELQHRRWYKPPSVVYERSLPEAARALARVLGLTFATTQVSEGEYRVECGANGWRVYRGDAPLISRVFHSRAAAERLARGLGPLHTYQVPVVWLDDLPVIRGIPLFGVGHRTLWLDVLTQTRRR